MKTLSWLARLATGKEPVKRPRSACACTSRTAQLPPPAAHARPGTLVKFTLVETVPKPWLATTTAAEPCGSGLAICCQRGSVQLPSPAQTVEVKARQRGGFG